MALEFSDDLMDNALDLHIKITWDLWYMGFVDTTG